MDLSRLAAKDLDAILWWAEAHRQNDLATSTPPENFGKLLQELRTTNGSNQRHAWASRLLYERLELTYEPRCLAVSEDGGHVAVGTKAGTIHILDLRGRSPKRLEYGAQHTSSSLERADAASVHEAIRGLTFVGRSILAAGTGAGHFLLFNLEPRNASLQPTQVSPRLPIDPDTAWSNRFVRIVPLVAPGDLPADERPVALGLTQGLRCHVLSIVGGHYNVENQRTTDLLNAWQVDVGSSEQIQVVDGGWARHKLWLLTSDGMIHRLSSDLKAEARLEIKLASPVFDPRRLAACNAGLGLLVSGQLSLMRFTSPDSHDLKAPDRWVTFDSITDFSVWQPRRPKPKLAKRDEPATEPPPRVWMVAGSDNPGLCWLEWSPEHPPISAPPHLAAIGDRSVLMTAFGVSEAGGTFLTAATRDHHLIVTSILDKPQTHLALDQLLCRLLDPAGPHSEEVFGHSSGHGDPASITAQWNMIRARFRTPGIGLWLLRVRLRADLGVARSKALLPPAWREASLLPMVQTLGAAQIRRLAQILIRRWPEMPGDEELRAGVFRRWSLLLLRRVVYSAPADLSVLARQLYDGMVGRQATAEHGSCWRGLRPFAGFLRKWVIQGRTYQIRDTNLLGRVSWNQRCGYDLDALVYLAKLTRRRFDTAWRISAVPRGAAPIRDLVAESSGQFSIQSHNDGRLTIISSDGRRLPWRSPRALQARISDAGFLTTESDLCLSRQDADEFRQSYRHGPYVRRLFLRDLGHDHLLLGCFRGGRRAVDRARLPPLFFALLLRPEFTDRQLTGLTIIAFGTRDLASEIYDIALLETTTRPPASTAASFRFLVGTRGSWRENFDDRPADTPFVELQVNIVEDRISIEPEALKVKLDTRGQRTVFRQATADETSQNPCWSLAVVRKMGRCWLWAGFHDGRLRCFERRQDERGADYWLEGGGGGVDAKLKESRDAALDRSIQCSAAVWTVLYIESEALLAYGTADGVVGMVSMHDLNEEARPPWVHLLHSRETAPICGLVSYEDADQHRLLTLSQEGYAALYQLRSLPVSEGEWRFDFSGLWKDRFPLNPSARALQLLPKYRVKAFGEAAPVLLVGTGDGHLYRHELLVPRGSARRREAAKTQLKLLANERRKYRGEYTTDTTPTLLASIGEQQDFFSWLRLLDTGGPEMVRFSFWAELRASGEDVLRQVRDGAFDKQQAEAYLGLLESLGVEAFRRRPQGRPEGRDPSKILWEEAAGLANRVAAQAIAEPSRAGTLLDFCNQIDTAVDDLCNRWIGSDQALEARVLIHSFNSFFDWTDLIVLAWLNPPEDIVSTVDGSRRYLLFNACKRRLSYGEPMVRLEAMRVINRSLVWAIGWAWKAKRPEIAIGLAPPRSTGTAEASQIGQDGGLFDLLRLVGDLAARQHDALSPADPISSEIMRFFALAILLVPESALVVGHTMSESRLLDRGPALATSIIALAKILASKLQLPREDPRLKAGLASFEAYCTPNIHFYAKENEDPENDAWNLLTAPMEPDQLVDDGVERVDDADFVSEQGQILKAALALADLEPNGVLDWLKPETRDLEYFFESYQALRYLARQRKKLLRVLRQDLAASLANPTSRVAPSRGVSDTQRAATRICQHALVQLREGDLFEPQRNLYGEIVRRWSERVEQRARRAVAVLDAIDKFNRHIYRTSADNLMTRILELALQVAPLGFTGAGRVGTMPLTRRVETALKDEHPLLAEIFLNGTDLVERTHLAGTLLELARDQIDGNQQEPTLSYEIEIGDIQRELKLSAVREQLKSAPPQCEPPEIELALGTRAFWQTVIHEWVKNIRRHGCAPELSEQPDLWSRIQRDGDRRTLLIAGIHPFSHCLTEDRRHQFEALDLPARPAWLLQRVKEAAVPGSKEPLGPNSGSSLGLFLIQLICDLVGVQAELTLRDLIAGPFHGDTPAAELLACPLCLELTWPAPPSDAPTEDLVASPGERAR